MTARRDRNWEFGDKNELVYGYFGGGYDSSEASVARMRELKRQYDAPAIARFLELEPSDIVADLGSGFGHIAAALAPQVRRLLCLDVSSEFLDLCRTETASLDNVEHHHIPRGDLSCVRGKDVNKIYANSVFIHLNLYDMVRYFETIAALLPAGGRFYFNFQDSDKLARSADPNFSHMRSLYDQDPLDITLMQWVSLTTLRPILADLGLRIRHEELWQYCATVVVVEKAGAALEPAGR